MKLVIKFEISQSTKTINFLDVFITINQLAFSITVFSRPTDARMYLNSIFCHPEHNFENILKLHFLSLHKICSSIMIISGNVINI